MKPTPTQIDMFSRKAAKAHSKEITELVPVAREIALNAGSRGVTVSDLRLTAIDRKLLPATSTGRQLSFLGAVMRAAKLVGSGAYRRSELDQAHGNLNQVWIHPDYCAPAAATG